MESEDHEHLADELDREADKLASENEQLDERIGDVRSDWETKRQDPSVPGATMPPEDADPEPASGSEHQD